MDSDSGSGGYNTPGEYSDDDDDDDADDGKALITSYADLSPARFAVNDAGTLTSTAATLGAIIP